MQAMVTGSGSQAATTRNGRKKPMRRSGWKAGCESLLLILSISQKLRVQAMMMMMTGARISGRKRRKRTNGTIGRTRMRCRQMAVIL